MPGNDRLRLADGGPPFESTVRPRGVHMAHIGAHTLPVPAPAGMSSAARSPPPPPTHVARAHMVRKRVHMPPHREPKRSCLQAPRSLPLWSNVKNPSALGHAAFAIALKGESGGAGAGEYYHQRHGGRYRHRTAGAGVPRVPFSRDRPVASREARLGRERECQMFHLGCP